mgnify:CR=1 FL=1
MHANRKLLMAAALALASAAAWAQGPYRMTLSGALVSTAMLTSAKMGAA